MPAQPLLGSAPLVNEIVAVIDEQLQLAQRSLCGPWRVERRLPQSGSGDRERVDQVRLAATAATAPQRRRQPRRHPYQPLPPLLQHPLQPPAHVTAILHRPQPPGAELLRPGEQGVVVCARRQGIELPAELVDRHCRQLVLVHVHPDHDHGHRLLLRWGRPASGQASLEAAAKLLSGHARRSREGGGDTTLASRHRPTVRNRVSRRRPDPLARTGRHRQTRMTVSAECQ